jgi:uncharacterized repeat protein (TIGR03803 family)
MAVMCVLGAMPGRAAGSQALHGHWPSAVSHMTPVGRLQSSQHLNLAISLPLRNQQALTDLLRAISDPKSPSYRHYLTPAQFSEKFGPSEADYLAVINFAKSHGLKITAMHPNRTIVDVEGAVPDIENTFHVRMWSYQHPTEARKFYAPDAEPSVDLAVPILGVSGLDNYSLPQPRLKFNAVSAKVYGSSPNTGGSAPNGDYMGNDFRTAYVPGVSLTGGGQSVGLLQFDGYTTSDITYYETKAGRPNITLTNVLLDGFSGAPTGTGGEVEVSLDIEMTISMAPGVSNILVYEAGPSGNWHDILNRMATDNLAKQLSCSWYIPGGTADTTADQIFQQMAAQGQSFYTASGDSDAFTGLIPFPGDTPYVTEVGGTTLTTSGSGGPYASETVWNRNNGIGSGGGISTQYAIPTWQQGISMTANLGSTTMRNVPDVALTGEGVYVRADGLDYDVGGTSCAAPLWAAFTALVNQQAVVNTGATVGFINPAVYAIGRGAGYTSDFHDTTVGNNFSPSSPAKFPAATGYDLGTGWGTPTGTALINALAGPPGPIVTTGSPLPSGVAGTAYNQTLTASGGTPSYTWSIFSGSLPTGLGLSSTGVISGSPTSTGTVGFTVQVTDSKGISSTTAFSLTIYAQGTPIIATGSPLPTGTVGAAYNQTLAASGGATPYTWSVSSGTLPLGLSLSSAGVISGAPTTTGTVSFTVQVTGNDGLFSTAPFSLAVNPAPTPPTITTTNPLANGAVGTAYNLTLAASGGTTPYAWSLASGSLPPGLGLSSAGVISGTPFTTGTASFSVRVTGGNGLSSTTAFTLTILPQGTLQNGSFETGGFSNWIATDIAGPFVPLQVRTNGYSPGYGLFSNTATDGVYSATCGFDGSGPGVIQIAQDISISASAPYLAFDYRVGWDMLDYGGSAQARTFTVTVQPSGGGSTLLTSVQLTAQPGTKNLDTGVLSGTVNLSAYAGTNIRICFNVNVPQAFTGPGYFELDNVRLAASVPPVITTGSPLPSGTTGATYSQILAASGGTLPYTWSIVSGGLPAGLSLSGTGVISGTPTTTGTASFTAKVTGNNGQSATKAFSLTINQASTPPSIINGPPPAAATVNTAYSFTFTSSGFPSPTFSVTSGSLPPGLTLSSAGVISGTPTQVGIYTGAITAGNGISPNATQNFSITVLTSLVQQYTVLHDFGDGSVPNDGNSSWSSLVQGGDGNFYGTTVDTGSASNGIAYMITPQGVETVLHGFSDTSVPNVGRGSYAALVLGSDGNFYGTTCYGGAGGGGVFKMTPQGVVTLLHLFGDGSVANDGSSPFDPLIQGADGNFYGTTDIGGSAGKGTIFRITPQGVVTILHSFGDGSVANDGANVRTPLVQGTDGSYYGTSSIGGSANQGMAFKVTAQGTFTVLHNFGDGSVAHDGLVPQAGLIQGSDGNFYSDTFQGGTANAGTLFKMTPQGVVTILHNCLDGSVTNDAYALNAGLIQASDGNFYGTCPYGGSTANEGTVFRMTPQGTVTLLYAFGSITHDGTVPYAPLVQGSDGSFYGTTFFGGTAGLSTGGYGIIFKLSLINPPVFTSPAGATFLAGQANSFTVTATGTPIFAASGLPAWASLNQGTGVLSGTPPNTSGQPFAITLTASNGISPNATQAFTLTVDQSPSITNGPPPAGTVNTPYSFTYASSGSPVPAFSVTSGTLPAGLTLSSAGVISGTPTTAGTSTGIVTAGNGLSPNATQAFSINIILIAPVINPEPPVTGGPTNTVSWNSVNGAAQYEVQASTSPSFATVTDSGWITGTTFTFSGLTPGTTYYYRVRARNTSSPDSSWSQASQTDFSADSLTNVSNGSGNLYVADSGNDTIRKVTLGGAVTTFAGLAGAAGSTDGTGSAARFNYTVGGVVDASGNFYMTDYNNDTIRKITLGGIVTTLAGVAGNVGSNDGTGSAARFNGPYGVALDGSGNLYVSDRLNQTVRKITPGGTVTTIAGVAGSVGSSDGTGSAARFNGPAEPAVDGNGNIYVPDQSNSTIRKITPGGVVTTLAGLAGSFASADGTGSAARFNNPSSIAVDGSGNLYVTDNGNQTIRKITPGGTVTTLAGLAGNSGSSDGTGSAARFDRPHGIAVDFAGTIYETDNFNFTVRKITPGGVVTTIAGSPLLSGSSDGTGSVARFNAPSGVSVNGSGGITLLYIGAGYAPAGTIVSTTIAPSSLVGWGILSYSDNVTASGTALTVDVLNSSGALLASNISSGTDLSILPAIAGATGIQLRANLSTSNSANTPTLSSWSVSYYTTGVSAWSATVTSTQGTVPTFTNGPPPATATVNTAYSFTYTASGSPTPTFSLTTGALPAGLTLSSAGVISGTPTATGIFPGTVTASNGVGAAATQNFTITVFTTFSSWANQWFTAQQLSDPTISGPNATPENDGIANLYKYLFDINPTEIMTPADLAALPVAGTTTTNGISYLTLTYRENPLASGITANVQTSPDLKAWQTVTPDFNQTVGTDPVTGDPIIEVGVAVGGSTRKFIELNVTSP